jgi:hypothetical protein
MEETMSVKLLSPGTRLWMQEQENKEKKQKQKSFVPPDGMKLAASGYRVPREVPKGEVLAHNDIMHTTRTPNGVRGFRWWTCPKSEVSASFVLCECGWSGLPHYALPGQKSVERVRL